MQCRLSCTLSITIYLISDIEIPLDAEKVFTEYGMPSSHAQFMGFFSAYFIFFIYIRCISNHVNVSDVAM